jgi:hypothetical protein
MTIGERRQKFLPLRTVRPLTVGKRTQTGPKSPSFSFLFLPFLTAIRDFSKVCARQGRRKILLRPPFPENPLWA